ncbi:hypothetical protein CDD80_5648 [Ophiocordyceps camponoti-rufipedis]|uniref:Phospholipid-transporting ATPase n=1 Tax=Ophiocordyceps camponoti-rufipedis TaxID=2004952 RepID=A0A2C5YQA1_9HYPO|nr:hypothetical protein CDD80_5648 [Ophiocordyceps camponoti-rufipedis]
MSSASLPEKAPSLLVSSPQRRHLCDDDDDDDDHDTGPRLSMRYRLWTAVKTVYQANVVRLIWRKRHTDASNHGRHIPLAIEHHRPLVDARRGYAYLSNNVRTSRYTIWDFIPKQLFFQFSRVGNFYFLCVGVPQMIPGLSTTGSFTTILPLFFFVLLTVAKEGYDDYRRHILDTVENANYATVLGRHDPDIGRAELPPRWRRWNPFRTESTSQPRPAPKDEYLGVGWVPSRWSQVKVGDVVLLSRDEPVPADLVLLHSDGENGVAYIDTMALDGETSLKTKQVCHALHGCSSIQGIAQCRADVVVEDPNPDLFNFQGRVTVSGKTVPLTLSDVVYRGSVLRNTRRAVGLVVNTGEECKVRMNSNQHPHAKRPALEKIVNKVVFSLAVYVLVLSVGVSMGYVHFRAVYEKHAWFLDGATVPFHQIIIAFIIMFNNVVPLSLYISLEIVKVGQLLLLNSDMDMYDAETDTPARCNTNTIMENLGQIGYVFSDKTGTLTDNVMKFRKLSVAGTVWLHATDLEESEDHGKPPTLASRSSLGRRPSSQWRSTGRPDHVQPEVNTAHLMEHMRLRPHSAFSRTARDYLLAVAICHTCLPEIKHGRIEFQASSPDELALVRAAQELGFGVTQRTSQSITVQVPRPNGQSEKMVFQILDVIEFSSARKRMSVVVRYPDGRISIICKGADSVILPRLRLSTLAKQRAHEVRKSAELEREMQRRSEQQEPRNSFGGRRSMTVRRNVEAVADGGAAPVTGWRSLASRSRSFEVHNLARSSVDRPRTSAVARRGVSLDVSCNQGSTASHLRPQHDRLDFLNDAALHDESEVFSRCFKHLDDFATEGLRTLVYAQRFVSDSEYRGWKKMYDEATTSLDDRQQMIEQAGELIESGLELVGATAIEDKLQRGVPEAIDRLRRANIKIWMLTGDKRETAINIAHSARICRLASDLYVLDSDRSPLRAQLSALAEDLQAGSVHSVVVIDGQTLAAVEKSAELSRRFFDLALLVDSVICCRASPAQKAMLVRAVRSRSRNKHGLTLAIGDGANDLAMIQASHVGVGISGKEGLQAARVADYAIGQFRFLQRLLLVHGRWNYVRTAKFVLCTFWKEMFFYLPTAVYQRYSGYSGTSLYQEVSLTVFNTLFTSLCTICMGIWEQDLGADTVLAVPELYVYGQRGLGLGMAKYLRWMAVAVVEGLAVWYGVWAGYGRVSPSDDGLYALGTLVFTVGVLWINWKLFILETHYKPSVILASFFLTTMGWFAWLAFLDGVYAPTPSGPYLIRHTLRHTWGPDPAWWSTLFLVLALVSLIEVAVAILSRRRRRRLLNDTASLAENVEEWDVALWQELEQDPRVRARLRRLARDEDCEDEAGVSSA